MLILGLFRLSKSQLCPAGLGKQLGQGPAGLEPPPPPRPSRDQNQEKTPYQIIFNNLRSTIKPGSAPDPSTVYQIKKLQVQTISYFPTLANIFPRLLIFYFPMHLIQIFFSRNGCTNSLLAPAATILSTELAIRCRRHQQPLAAIFIKIQTATIPWLESTEFLAAHRQV